MKKAHSNVKRDANLNSGKKVVQEYTVTGNEKK
jgi:hypothetical protein